MRTSPLLADFIHARGCKPICAKLLTLPAKLLTLPEAKEWRRLSAAGTQKKGHDQVVPFFLEHRNTIDAAAFVPSLCMPTYYLFFLRDNPPVRVYP